MDTQSKEQLRLLRKQIPVGISDGLRLLHNANNDIAGAVVLFTEELTEAITLKTGISREEALVHAQDNELDYHKTLLSVYLSRYSLSEAAIRFYEKDKEAAIFKIAEGIPTDQPFPLWLQTRHIQQLNAEELCIASVTGWLTMAAHEGWEASLTIDQLSAVTDEMEQKLGLNELALCLRSAAPHAIAIQNDLSAQNNDEQHVSTTGTLRDYALMDRYKRQFRELRPLLIERLYGYAENNLEQLP